MNYVRIVKSYDINIVLCILLHFVVVFVLDFNRNNIKLLISIQNDF